MKKRERELHELRREVEQLHRQVYELERELSMRDATLRLTEQRRREYTERAGQEVVGRLDKVIELLERGR